MHPVRLALLAIGSTMPLMAQFSYQNCDDLKASDFAATELFNKNGTPAPQFKDAALAEPVRMDLHGVMEGDVLKHVDVYFVERKTGHVKRFDGGTKTVATMGTISVRGVGDSGLMGIVLHPDFATNRWLFLWYIPPVPGATSAQNNGGPRKLRLARFLVTQDYKLDMESEKILIEIEGSNRDQWHSGGPMTFDKHKDLWIQVGNNSSDHNSPSSGSHLHPTERNYSDEWGASNTANMRGGTLRIHPDDSEKGYHVPAGNFGEYWAGQWELEGNAALAAEYRNPAKVLPEVYVKGSRSNASISVHPTKRWLAWGEVNPGGGLDETNLTAHPIFAGYPYFNGDNKTTTGSGHQKPETPLNTSGLNTGVQNLPPAIPGAANFNINTHPYNVVFSGPINVYDQSLKSTTKLPPHLHNKLFGLTFGGKMVIQDLDTNSLAILKTTRVDLDLFSSGKLRQPIQAMIGPEGALYILNYGTGSMYSSNAGGVMRIDYVGGCHLPVVPGTSIGESGSKGLPAGKVILGSTRLLVRTGGSHEFHLFDMNGSRLARKTGQSGAEYRFRDLQEELRLRAGLYVVRVETAEGVFDRTVSLFQ